MKAISKRIVVLLVSVLLLAALAVGSAYPAFAAVKYYNDYETVDTVANKGGCTAMQGLAVGSKYAYSVKANVKTNEKAFITKTNLKTGNSVVLKTSKGETYLDYIGHANGMDCATIDGKTNLYIATMLTGKYSLVRMAVDGSTVTKKGNYTIKYNGEAMMISGIAITKKTDTKIELLVKKGQTYYKGSISPTAKSGTINVTKAFSLNLTNVKINGKSVNVSQFVSQGFGYTKGYLYVPFWSNVKKNQSVIAVYYIKGASGVVTSDPNLSFRITSKSYPTFEIEDCDICSSDGKLYFNTNRSKDNKCYDGIHSITDYKFN